MREYEHLKESIHKFNGNNPRDIQATLSAMKVLIEQTLRPIEAEIETIGLSPQEAKNAWKDMVKIPEVTQMRKILRAIETTTRKISSEAAPQL